MGSASGSMWSTTRTRGCRRLPVLRLDGRGLEPEGAAAACGFFEAGELRVPLPEGDGRLGPVDAQHRPHVWLACALQQVEGPLEVCFRAEARGLPDQLQLGAAGALRRPERPLSEELIGVRAGLRRAGRATHSGLRCFAGGVDRCHAARVYP